MKILKGQLQDLESRKNRGFLGLLPPRSCRKAQALVGWQDCRDARRPRGLRKRAILPWFGISQRLLKYITYAAVLFASDFSYAELKDHLKKAEGKTDTHTMRNIDFIYMINLDQRPEKYAMSLQYLSQYDIHPYRFSAINGWELSLEGILDVGLKFTPGMTPLLGTTFLMESGKLLFSHEFMHFHHGYTLLDQFKRKKISK